MLSITSQQAGWNHERYAQYRLIKLELENEALRIKNNNWEKLISHTENKYSDSKAFWRQIRRIKGKLKITLLTRWKIIEDKDKERTFKGMCKEIYNISPEENQRFDLTHEHEVNLMQENRKHEIEPDETSNLNTPRHADDIMISIRKLNRIINSFKNNTTGESQINKVILQKLPASAIS